MADVAVVTDTTHYLPPALLAEAGVREVSLYVNEGGGPSARPAWTSTAFYDRLRTGRELPTTSQPSIGDFLAVYDPLLEAGRDIVSIHISGAISGTVEAARQAAADAVARHPGRAWRSWTPSRPAAASARSSWAPPPSRARAATSTRRGPRGGDRRPQPHLVLGRHPRVPAPGRPHRRRAGLARRRAEDQADPDLRRRRDQPGRAGPHPASRVRAHGRVPADFQAAGATSWMVQHIQAPDQAEALVGAGARSSGTTRCSSRRSAPSSGRTRARASSGSPAWSRSTWRPSSASPWRPAQARGRAAHA